MKIIKKKLLFTFFLIATGSILNAQNPIWTIPGNNTNENYLEWDIVNPVIPIKKPLPQNGTVGTGYTGIPAENTHNAISDAQGELLFFQVDDIVYDKIGSAIGIFSNNTKGNAETLIVPDPADCERYYLFSLNGNLANDNFNPRVSLLDMSMTNCDISINANSEYGQFVQVNAPNNESIPINFPLSGGIDFSLRSFPNSNTGPFGPGANGHFGNAPSSSASRTPFGCFHASDLKSDINGDPYRYVWISNGRLIYVIKLTKQGIEFIKTHDSDAIQIPGGLTGTGANNVFPLNDVYEMDVLSLPNGNYRFACVVNSPLDIDEHNAVSIFDLNPNTMNIVSGSHQRFDYLSVNANNHTKIPGLEFSPNGNFLFVSHSVNSIYSNAIDIIRLSDGSTWPLTEPGSNDFAESQIELGPDGKMYFITDDRMASFSNPNLAVFGLPPLFPVQFCSTCWNNNEISLNNYNSTSGFSSTDNVFTLPRQIEDVDIQQLAPGGEKFFTASGTQTWTPNFNPINNASGQSGVNTVVIHCELRILQVQILPLKTWSLNSDRTAESLLKEVSADKKAEG